MSSTERDEITRLIEGDNQNPCYKTDPNGSLFVNFVLRSGDQFAFPYSLLSKLSLKGGKEIELMFAEQALTIEGLQLEEVYVKLLQQEVCEVKEHHSTFVQNRHLVSVNSIRTPSE